MHPVAFGNPFEGWNPEPWFEFARSPGFGGTAALLAAIVAYLGIRKTVKQKEKADRRAAWWERFQWVAEHMFDDADPDMQVVAGILIGHLQDARLAGREEQTVVSDLLEYVFEREAPQVLESTVDPGSTQDDDEGDTGQPGSRKGGPGGQEAGAEPR